MSSGLISTPLPDGKAIVGGSFNIASVLPSRATERADQPAVIVTRSRDRSDRPVYASISFNKLESLSNRYANALISAGIIRGMRVLIMVRPGFAFTGLIFALFKIGAVPVMIDPGMGVGRMMECIRTVDLHALIGIPKAHVMRLIRRDVFLGLLCVVTVGRRWCWGGASLELLANRANDRFDPVDTAASETAAILFTSGSTGPAKGVVYTHGMFGSQVRMIQSHYGIEPGEVDLPTFPLFALFSTAMGMTAVIPDMDPSRPARVKPERIVEAILDHGVTNSFGSPALWSRVGPYCAARRIRLPSLRRILIAGAPVPFTLIDTLHAVLDDNADVHTPYGATEALPVTSISGRLLSGELSERSRRGAGSCVGRAYDGIEVRIIAITDEPIADWSETSEMPDGEIGEITATGPIVMESYYGLDRATALSRIRDGDRAWHRMGDVGYRDDAGRIWMCGRKSHRVTTQRGTLYTVPCEAIFNQHLSVHRCALVGVGPRGHQEPVLVVECKDGAIPRGRGRREIVEQLQELGERHDHTRDINRFLFRRSLPVDVRHNAKINREQLAEWAVGRVS